MFFLSIKKAFFDAWDNLISLILCNIAFIALMMLGLWPMFQILGSENIEGLIILLILIPLLFIAIGTISALMSIVADFKSFDWSEIPVALKKTWSSSAGLALIVCLFVALLLPGIRYYSGLNSIIGIGAAALLFWLMIGSYLSLMWFFAVKNRLSGNFKKLLKKSALIMMDNLGLSLFTGFIMIPLQMILWPLTAFCAFGPTGIQLYMNVSLRLLMYKYDWLEEHQDARKKDVPWYELLVEERERVGPRTLRGMIFPWKE